MPAITRSHTRGVNVLINFKVKLKKKDRNSLVREFYGAKASKS